MMKRCLTMLLTLTLVLSLAACGANQTSQTAVVSGDDTKNITFVSFENLTITLTQPTDFCMDGELATFDGKIDVNLCKADTPITVISKEELETAFKQGKSF